MQAKTIYQPPEHCKRNLSEMSDRELLSYYSQDEICVQTVAWIYLYTGSFIIITTSFLIKISISIEHLMLGFMSIVTLLLGIIYILLGWGMRHYDPWSRIPARFAAIIMMFFVPLGTLTGMVCYILLKKRADREIFTHKYHAILLSDPLHKNYQRLWIPLFIGSISAVITISIITFQSKTIIQLLKTYLSL